MYKHVNVTIADKEKLYEATRQCCSDDYSRRGYSISCSRPGNDKFLLTDFQRGQLSVTGKATITCFRDQILQYAGNCLDKSTLMKILAEKNSDYESVDEISDLTESTESSNATEISDLTESTESESSNATESESSDFTEISESEYSSATESESSDPKLNFRKMKFGNNNFGK